MGAISRYYISLSNNHLNLILFFADCLKKFFNVKRERIEITIRTSPNIKKIKTKKVAKFLKMKDFRKITVLLENKRRFARREPNVQLRFNSGVMAKFIHNIMRDLFDIIQKSPNEIKAAYLRGFVAAEGSVYQCRSQRAISISQKDTMNLNFLRNF